MLNSDSKDCHVAVDVTKGLSLIAPVYYALGNHEINYMESQGDGLLDELKAAGADILELDSQDIEVNGQKIRVGGMFDYAFALDGNDSTLPEHMVPEVYEFLTDFQWFQKELDKFVRKARLEGMKIKVGRMALRVNAIRRWRDEKKYPIVDI